MFTKDKQCMLTNVANGKQANKLLPVGTIVAVKLNPQDTAGYQIVGATLYGPLGDCSKVY